uniref:VWFA domain-containing protein n=1 Tax=Ditylenchus dipsaci TaxID=166011 RepID=A0A915DPW8_9BILA
MLSSLGKKNQGVVSSNIICIDSTCSCYNLVHSTNEVKSDITFSIDASSAMGNTSNINEAMLWLINNIFQNVSISENSAGIAIQKAGINFVNTEILFSNISIYKILDFCMITAATDDSILNAVEIANDIKQSGTKILVVALNQTDLSFNNSFYAISENVRLSTVTPIALKPFVRQMQLNYYQKPQEHPVQ